MSPLSAGVVSALCAAVLLLTGCGDEDPAPDTGRSAAPPAATATEPATAELEPDALRAVRDRLAGCLRTADVGAVVRLRDGEAVVEGSGRPPRIDASLAAPEETAAAIEDGAQYVGLRDDERTEGLTPDWDVLIYPSQDAAAQARIPLSQEAGDPVAAEQRGRYVTVVLPAAEANGDDPEGADARLAACQVAAERG